ncbi:MAG: nickel pincer cofactor biosynthesis protein LarC [Eubacteriales bacterium]|nr:nickel pincer cofactor biosynthesis protein LarC [Eubacteriales bacterium]
MKTLYIDCPMGAAGDMLTAALLELLPDREAFLSEMNNLGIPGVRMGSELTSRCGIVGARVTVTVDGREEHSHDHDHGQDHGHEHDRGHEHDHSHEHEQDHDHANLDKIGRIIEKLKLSAKVKADVLAVYRLIAEAESKAHGVSVSDIHFHEVGTMDAVADITAVCLLMERIAPRQVIVSPVHVGSGQVRCAHGILPVPAPATAYILRDVPVYGGAVRGELCTPTGAALLKHFASAFGDMPVMRIEAIGYGMGTKEFEAANCVRVMLGETEDRQDGVTGLSCNVDDMTAEEIGFAMERLFEAGALEVFTVPAGMKKSRPGTLICVLCREGDKEKIIKAVFKYTATIGVREIACCRYVLEREFATVDTPWGSVRRKDSAGYGVRRSKYEYDDLAKIAAKKNMSIADVIRLIEKTD